MIPQDAEELKALRINGDFIYLGSFFSMDPRIEGHSQFRDRGHGARGEYYGSGKEKKQQCVEIQVCEELNEQLGMKLF